MRVVKLLGPRLLGLAVVFFGVTFIIYAMVWALPGDPIAALGGDRPLPPNVVEELRRQFHLDDPLWLQYLRYLGGIFTGNLGTTLTGTPVADQMASRWPVTITLALTAWGIEVIMGVALGLIAGLRRGTWIDRGVLLSTIVATSIPIFVVAVSAQLIFGVKLRWSPIAGTSAGWPAAYIVPAFVIAVFGLAAVARLMRGSVIDTMRSDFVRTLRAKGLPKESIVGEHVLRNSISPVLTFVAIDLGLLLGGTVVVEGIFNLPGLGQLLFSAIRIHEGPTVVAISTTFILVFLILSLLVDIVNSVLDPRIRHD